MFLSLFIVIILVIGVLGYRAIGDQTTVASASAAATPAATPAAETNDNAVIDAAAMPASDWKSRDPIQPSAPTGKIHTVSFDMTEVQIRSDSC